MFSPLFLPCATNSLKSSSPDRRSNTHNRGSTDGREESITDSVGGRWIAPDEVAQATALNARFNTLGEAPSVRATSTEIGTPAAEPLSQAIAARHNTTVQTEAFERFFIDQGVSSE